VRERGVAKRSRRNATIPPHDPRAIAVARRRDLYQVGDALRHLDDIAFRPVPAHGTVFVSPIVNGTDLGSAIRHHPLHAGNLAWHHAGLTDAEGDRLHVPLTEGPGDGNPSQRAHVKVSAYGKYVRWETPDSLDRNVFVFDRASYREQLATALAEYMPVEREQSRLIREFFQRTPWAGPESMGLFEPELLRRPHVNGFALAFRDPFWRARVRIALGRRDEDLAGVLARATVLIARWDLDEFQGQWCGTVRPPAYPLHWQPTPCRFNPSGGLPNPS
jgi:hypothetical protein